MQHSFDEGTHRARAHATSVFLAIVSLQNFNFCLFSVPMFPFSIIFISIFSHHIFKLSTNAHTSIQFFSYQITKQNFRVSWLFLHPGQGFCPMWAKAAVPSVVALGGLGLAAGFRGRPSRVRPPPRWLSHCTCTVDVSR